ncbi:YaiI/YqxD family protein [Caldithrix abyssi]
MKIWVDADACPRPVKEIIYRAANRLKIKTIFVSNQPLKIPSSDFLSFKHVAGGLDVADGYIVEEMTEGDMVITADIPLAARVIEKQGFALNPRGQLYTKENIGYFLSIRNFMDDLRSSGLNGTGPPPLSQKDRQNFANQLDQFLQKHHQR